MSSTLCALCGMNPPIKNSHSIPHFVIAWIKRTSATGYLRQAICPNVAKQDIEKFPLLCVDCEGILSKFEQSFAKEVFCPFLERDQAVFEYADWLLRFAISLAWRTIATQIEECRGQIASNLLAAVDMAMRCWQDFLLQKAADCGPYTHHLLFFDYLPESEGVAVPEGLHHYLLRCVDATIVKSSKSIFVYTKLPGMIFWTGVQPADIPGWHGTRILQQGNISRGQTVDQPGWGEWLVKRVEEINGYMSGMSDRQAQRIEQRLMSDPDRALRSNTYKAVEADNYWDKRQGRS